MALILNIETSTDVCSVSISENGKCKSLKLSLPSDSVDNKAQHSRLLAVFIDDILKENDILPSQIDALAISSGPGSYTGLRIGASTAKGFCFGQNIPLISVDTLKIVAAMAKLNESLKYDYYIPMIDAKRMEVYTKTFNPDLIELSSTEAKIIDDFSFENLGEYKVLFCGNGAEKCEKILNKDTFYFNSKIFPSAEYMCDFSELEFEKENFVDLVYFEPFYLKDFIATVPRKKIF